MFSVESLANNMMWLSLLNEHCSMINRKYNKDMLVLMELDKSPGEGKEWLWLKMISMSNHSELLKYKTPYRTKEGEEDKLVTGIEAMAYVTLNESIEVLDNYNKEIKIRN